VSERGAAFGRSHYLHQQRGSGMVWRSMSTLKERYEYFRALLEEAGECECENCVEKQKTQTEAEQKCQTK
jgi:hypothetical protein